MDPSAAVVYGERLVDLLPALQVLRDGMRRRPNGSYYLRMRLEPHDAAPFRRALLRAEAELMLEDADTFGSPFENDRTHEQRAADALLRVAEALAA